VSRREAREHIMKLLFQTEFMEEDEYDQLADYYLERFQIGDKYQDFILGEYRGTIANQDKIDEIIESHSRNWKTSRMAKLDLTILRLAVYEMYYEEDIPNNVAINEAVELAKKYSSDKSPAFINGLLANIVKGIEDQQ